MPGQALPGLSSTAMTLFGVGLDGHQATQLTPLIRIRKVDTAAVGTEQALGLLGDLGEDGLQVERGRDGAGAADQGLDSSVRRWDSAKERLFLMAIAAMRAMA